MITPFKREIIRMRSWDRLRGVANGLSVAWLFARMDYGHGAVFSMRARSSVSKAEPVRNYCFDEAPL